jgi:hypothetical protein
MTSFLFWNVMAKDLRTLIARAVVEHDVDILLLAESTVPDPDMVVALKMATGKDYAPLSGNGESCSRHIVPFLLQSHVGFLW